MLRKKLLIVFAASFLGLSFNFLLAKKLQSYFSDTEISNNEPGKQNTIRVALLLDTSGSMNGLIEQAKSQLWQILGELSRTERNGQDPNLKIALYEYGNPSRASNRNQIRQLSHFTSDMDLISEKLFALTTDGGEEYCGQVILTSLENLEWGSNPNDLKLIYIAGNEPFTQGPVNYAKACQLAKKQDITVNTIFCGKFQEGVNSMWKQGALLANGEYMNIDHNSVTTYTETPYDKDINRLNKKLNETYIPYGKKGEEKIQNQSVQDNNAQSYSYSNAADRAAFKSSKKYKADDWDLVDAYKKDKNVLNNTEMLTDSLQNISIEELEKKIAAAAAARASIQNQIQELDKNRRIYIKENMKNPNANNLQNSMLKSIRNQAKAKGYKIKE